MLITDDDDDDYNVYDNDDHTNDFNVKMSKHMVNVGIVYLWMFAYVSKVEKCMWLVVNSCNLSRKLS